jgi:ring-1,2-phenylacetyl-CoA epoxidase subunit PaaB
MSNQKTDTQWRLWEVFYQARTGRPFEHAGSVHAPDAEMALQNARDTYTRRGEALQLWVVPSDCITASSSDDSESFFDPSNDKVYRHPSFYKIPKGVNLDIE